MPLGGLGIKEAHGLLRNRSVENELGGVGIGGGLDIDDLKGHDPRVYCSNHAITSVDFFRPFRLDRQRGGGGPGSGDYLPSRKDSHRRQKLLDRRSTGDSRRADNRP